MLAGPIVGRHAMTYYRSTVIDVGPEAPAMAAAGVIILFGEPLPEALAEVSVVHRPSQTLQGHAIGVGDIVTIGEAKSRSSPSATLPRRTSASSATSCSTSTSPTRSCCREP
jgi:hypothetical protein